MNRRTVQAIFIALGYLCCAVSAHGADKKIVVLPFEFVDATQSDVQIENLNDNLDALTELLKTQFKDNDLFQVLDGPEIQAEVKRQLSRYDFRDCNGCDQDIASLAGADFTAASWVRMASALIQSITVEIRDGKTSKVVLRKSADIQGRSLSNWKRGVRYVVRRMNESKK